MEKDFKRNSFNALYRTETKAQEAIGTSQEAEEVLLNKRAKLGAVDAAIQENNAEKIREFQLATANVVCPIREIHRGEGVKVSPVISSSTTSAANLVPVGGFLLLKEEKSNFGRQLTNFKGKIRSTGE